MKRLFFVSLGLLFFAGLGFAQDAPTAAEYRKYIDSQINMAFRTAAYEAIGLTSEEIVAFDPLFFRYMPEREDLLQRKVALLDQYNDEMKEDDSAANKEEDRADFVENYWEVEIKEMELSKDYFDRLEDEIPVAKALQFFLFERAVEDRIQQNVVRNLIPAVDNLDQIADRAMAASAQATKEALSNQDGMVSREDYRKYIDSRLEIDFRNESLKALDLTEEEIIAFDPLFFRYMASKENLLEKKMELLENIREELQEDDDAEDEANELADFIENYWEVEIDEMDLRKEYFDVLENKIPMGKALRFFLWEDAVQNRLQRSTLESILPGMIVIRELATKDLTKTTVTSTTTAPTMPEPPTTTSPHNTAKMSIATQQLVLDYDQWLINNKGKVSLSHEYTSNGLKALVNILEAVRTDLNVQIPNFAQHKQTIMKTANHITVDPLKTDHADHTRLAFESAAALFSAIEGADASALESIAKEMNPDRLMTRQARTIYRFFDEANRQLKKMSEMQTLGSRG